VRVWRLRLRIRLFLQSPSSNMSKSAALNAAVLVCGSYQAARVFVPTLLGSSAAPEAGQAALSGAAPAAPAASSSVTGPSLVVVGAASLVASSCAPRTRRKAAAAAVDVEAPAPPPPFNPAEQYGAGAPLGFFDPLGFSKVGDEEGFRRMRIAELKHGRVAMMASVGAVIQHYWHFPGFEKVPNGLGAATSGGALFGFAALVAVSGFLELVLWKEKDSKNMLDIGNYGNPFQPGPPLGEGLEMRSRELENGRAAMIAILGIVFAELATGRDGMQQLGFD